MSDDKGFSPEDFEWLDDEDLDLVLNIHEDLKIEEKEEPTLQFCHGANKIQEMFLEFVKQYQFIWGSNKLGKSFVASLKVKLAIEGIDPTFLNRPPLSIWMLGESLDVLNETPTQMIEQWFRPDQIHKVKVGNLIKRLDITNEKGIKSSIMYKPFTLDESKLESANLDLIFCDEECPERIFKALPARLVAKKGKFYNTLTPTKGIRWTNKMFEGQGPFGHYMRDGKVEVANGSIFENQLNLPAGQVEDMANIYKGDPKLYAIRVLGQAVSLKGSVYVIERQKYNQKLDRLVNYHYFDLGENPPLDELKFFGALDWGKNEPFCFMIIGIDKNNNWWVFDEIYERGLGARQQAKKIKERVDHWGIHLEQIVADNQILNDLPDEFEGYEFINCIWDIYRDELGDYFTTWRMEETDKRNPDNAREKLADRFNSQKIRFLKGKTHLVLNELENFEYAEEDTSKTSGRDDAEACLRYFTHSGIKYDFLTTAGIKDIIKGDRKYHEMLNSPY